MGLSQPNWPSFGKTPASRELPGLSHLCNGDRPADQSLTPTPEREEAGQGLEESGLAELRVANQDTASGQAWMQLGDMGEGHLI